MTAPKKPASKKPRVRKSRAKPPKDNPPADGPAAPPVVAAAAAHSDKEVEWVVEQSVKVARNADPYTRDAKRHKAIVEVVLSRAAGMLQNMMDDGGELQEVGVQWATGTGHYKPVPYHEIVAAFVARAPYLAASKVDDQR